MPDGATIASGKTLRAVPAIKSQASPDVGVRGAGSILEPGLTERLTWLLRGDSDFSSKAENVMLRDETTGDRIDAMRVRVSLTEDRKSIR